MKWYHISRQQGLQCKIKTKSLKKACHSVKLPSPKKTTLDGVLLEIYICETKPKELEPKAHKLRKSFMLHRLANCKDQDDAEGRKEQRIIVNKGKKKWKQIRSTLGKVRSLPASKVATMSKDGGCIVHLNEVDVHLALKEHLVQTACNSPITRGQIF